MVTAVETPAFLRRDDFDQLIALLRDDGRTVIAPTVVDGAIVYDEIRSAADLPAGWRDEQAPGSYRLVETDNERTFDFSVGPTSWKRYTFPSRVPIGRAERGPDGLSFAPIDPEPPALAFLGVRGCELAALRIQDRVLAEGSVADPDYVARRRAALVIAVECSVASATCFCTSMGTGPEVRRDDADLVLTELDDGFVVRAGSEAGQSLAERLPLEAAGVERTEQGRANVARVRAAIGDPVAVDGLRDRLLAQLESPRWAEVADRCLACANCTLVCPTCFCTSVSQVSDLDGDASVAVRRQWDSCFYGRLRQGRRRQLPLATRGPLPAVADPQVRDVDRPVRNVRLRRLRPLHHLVSGRHRRPRGARGDREPATASTIPSAGCGRCARSNLRPAASNVSMPETADTTTLVVGVDPLIAGGRPGQFVMVDPARPAGRADLDLALPADGRPDRAVDPGGGSGHRDPWPAGDRRRSSASAVRSARAGPSWLPTAVMSSSWPAGSGCLRCARSSTNCSRRRDRFGSVRLYHGARTPDDRPHVPDLEAWARRPDIDLAVTVDRAGAGWTGPVGVVTHLFDPPAGMGAKPSRTCAGPNG